MTRAVLAGVLAAALGCGGFIDRQAASSTLKILTSSQVAARRMTDVELAREALPGGILQMEAFAIAYPKERGFRVLHADSLCQYAVAFVFDDHEDAVLTGRDADATRIASRLSGLLASCEQASLALLPAAWRTARADASRWAAQIAAARVEDVGPLLWIATTDAVRVALDPMRNLARLGSAIAALERVLALKPGFHDADAELLLGSLEAGRSSVFGGSDGSARFAAARKHLGEGALLVDVMTARGPAVARKDRAQFTRLLEGALAADLSRWPERRLANELAVRKARRYLDAIDRLIPPD